MRRFVVTLVVAAILAVASLFPMARSAYAEPPSGMVHGDTQAPPAPRTREPLGPCTTTKTKTTIGASATKRCACPRVLNATTPLVSTTRGVRCHRGTARSGHTSRPYARIARRSIVARPGQIAGVSLSGEAWLWSSKKAVPGDTAGVLPLVVVVLLDRLTRCSRRAEAPAPDRRLARPPVAAG